MSLSVAQRPTSFDISNSSAVTATYSGTVITKTTHGLSTGNYVYIEDNEAIGFWYVTILTADTFNIREYPTATVYTFVGVGSLTYYLALRGNEVAVHLPIIYRLQSTKWPINTFDTARTVTSYTDDNGYIKLNCSGVLNADISELEFVKVTFTGGESVVYQVIGFYSTSSVTINLPYIAGLTFVSVQYYYNNYHARIRLYAGLEPSHYWASQKPYTLITEQRIIPDENGIIVFNANEFLKEQIGILENNLLSGTMPMNLDAFCNFYITYAEGYDYTEGGYTLMDFVSSYTDDSLVDFFFAYNADLPFKNIYSGMMTEYAGSINQKFLTPTLYPELTPGQYFDISFINSSGSQTRIKKEAYVNGEIVNLTFDTIDNFGRGVYRYSVEQSEYLEDRIDLTVQPAVGVGNVTETKTITVNKCCSANEINLTWLNYLGGFDYWVFKSDSDLGIEIESAKTVKKNIFTNWPKSYGKGADTINQQTQRISRQVMTIRAENLTEDQISDLFRIRTSPLVQIVVSREDKRTVIVDSSSFVYLQQRGKLFNLQFNISFTDNQPSQSL